MDTILFVIVISFIIILSTFLISERITRRRELNRAYALLAESKKLEEKLYSIRSKGYITNSNQNIEDSSTEYIDICNALIDQIFDLKLEAELLLLRHNAEQDIYNENQ